MFNVSLLVNNSKYVTRQSCDINDSQHQQEDEEGDKFTRLPLKNAQFCEFLSQKKLYKLEETLFLTNS